MSRRRRRIGRGWSTLLCGIMLWGATATVSVITRNPGLTPTLILVGSFLVPFSIVMFVIERTPGGRDEVVRVILAFFLGGALGVVMASLLELGLAFNLWVYFGVGFIEEAVKGGLLLALAWRHPPRGARQGALFGAVIGAGFAAFESAGYAYRAIGTDPALGLTAVIQDEAIRAALTPLGHVLWTAILGAAIFRSRGPKARKVVTAVAGYVTVALLHALWDSMEGISQIAALLLTGNGFHAHRYDQFFAQARHHSQAVRIASVAYPVGIVVISVIGATVLITLILTDRKIGHSDRRSNVAGPPDVAPALAPTRRELCAEVRGEMGRM